MTAMPERPTPVELQLHLSPISCTTWCVHQDGHRDCSHAVDQRCETEEARAYLQLPGDDGRRDHDYVTTYVERQGPQATPTIHLGFDGDLGADLTPAEARMLARHLRRMARVARTP